MQVYSFHDTITNCYSKEFVASGGQGISRMDLFELETFLAVAREGSFSRAAKKLFRTQPAISQAVRKLERELGWRPAETFATGIRKTVRWYLDHADWVAEVQSGAYRDWVAANYAGRATEAAAVTA